MVRFLIGVACFALVGCAGGDPRWRTARTEVTMVDDLPYQVSWLPAGERQYDFQTRGPTVLPEPLIERDRNLVAAQTVARRLCNSMTINVLGVRFDWSAQQNVIRIQCG